MLPSTSHTHSRFSAAYVVSRIAATTESCAAGDRSRPTSGAVIACVSGVVTRSGPRIAMPWSVAASEAPKPRDSPKRRPARAIATPPGSVSQNCAAGAMRAPTNDAVATCARPRESSVPGEGDGSDTRPLLRDVLVGGVARAHERPGGDVVEAQLVGGGLQRLELVGMPIAHDRQVALAGPQVLADGEDLHAVLAQLAERVDHLLEALAEPDHEAGLRRHLVAAHLLGVGEHAQRARPCRPAPGDAVQARDGLDVVVEDGRALGDDLGQRHLVALEVRGENLDLAAWRLAADLADHADERARPLVGQVVAVDAGDDRVAQPHAGDAPGDARGLERVVPRRLTGLDVAEAAAARARVAEDHERGRAALPALADVRARRFLADRVQVLGADQVGQLAVARAAGRRDLEPRRLALAHRPDVGSEDLQDVHPAGVRAGARLVLTDRVGHGLER